MIKIRKGNITMSELFLEIRNLLLHAIEYSETNKITDLKSALSIIQGAASDRGDNRATSLAMDMQSAIDDWLQRDEKKPYIPSEESINEAFSESNE